MKKINVFFAGFAALALMASCSEEEVINGGGNEENKPQGEVAYLAVTINDVNASRSTGSVDDSNFQDSEADGGETANEHVVKHISFFFYDEGGNLVHKAFDPTPAVKPNDPANDNVEYVGTKSVLVLEDLTSNSYPNYMLTVVNAPDFNPEGLTLEAAGQQLANYVSKDGDFVMTTSSFKGDKKNHADTYYWATKLEPENFYLTADAAMTNPNPVQVYIERLAAKVQVEIAMEKTDNGLYKIETTLSDNEGDSTEGEGDAIADKALYIKVVGWGLNATADDSYFSKQIDLTNWDNDLKWTWNDAANWRSYWAASRLYNQEITDGAAANGATLTYNESVDMTKKFGFENKTVNVSYCNENTNKPSFITESKNDPQGQSYIAALTSKTTHVVIRAQVCDVKGNPVDLISYRGLLFTTDYYKATLLNQLRNGASKLNFWYLTGSAAEGSATIDDYTQVGADDLKVVKEGDKLGVVKIALAEPDKQLYKKVDNTGTEGSHFEKVTASDEYQLATLLAEAQTGEAINYNGGESVYRIPLEHYGAEKGKGAKGDESYYGVVRNHWYQLTVSKFSKVGHGVFDPEHEQIKGDETEPDYYYLAANINILSWKMVSQEVEL